EHLGPAAQHIELGIEFTVRKPVAHRSLLSARTPGTRTRCRQHVSDRNVPLVRRSIPGLPAFSQHFPSIFPAFQDVFGLKYSSQMA
ncbi:MAG: hypothetical protein L0Y56_08745, partial [Nitrospira sp.]|nr:hypothetical protein [Nitrospira sp.]